MELVQQSGDKQGERDEAWRRSVRRIGAVPNQPQHPLGSNAARLVEDDTSRDPARQ